MTYTDISIPIACPECDGRYVTEGIYAMIQHVSEVHKNYTAIEAIEAVEQWVEDAYEAEDLREFRATEYETGKPYRRMEP